MEPLLRFEEVDGLTLALPAGGCLALLGPGAAEALALVARHARPRTGRLLLDGRDLARVPPSQSGIARAGPEVARGRTVAAWLAEALAPLRLAAPARAARIARALTALGLDGAEGLRVEQLAPARQRRAAIAAALVAAPRLLLLDDPLAGLDPAPRRALALALRPVLRAPGLATLLVTAEPEEAMVLADRIVVLEAGRVLQDGTPRDLYEMPESALVAGLFGECNRLPGTIEALFDGECSVRLDCGPVVDARHGDAGGPGSRCIVAVRPEKVAVAALSAEEMGEGALPAALRDALFLGEHWRLVLEIGAGGMLVATRPAGGRLPRPGGPASVAWDAGVATAFRAVR